MSVRRYKNKLTEMIVVGYVFLIFCIASLITILVMNINPIFILISIALMILGITFVALGYKSIRGLKRSY